MIEEIIMSSVILLDESSKQVIGKESLVKKLKDLHYRGYEPAYIN
jgi:hypothetical protein